MTVNVFFFLVRFCKENDATKVSSTFVLDAPDKIGTLLFPWINDGDDDDFELFGAHPRFSWTYIKKNSFHLIRIDVRRRHAIGNFVDEFLRGLLLLT